MMTLFWALFTSFFRIGLFSFGGGYAMIPMIQNELVNVQGFMTAREVSDVIAITQMTPGSIAVNVAAFAGTKLGGLPAACVAIFGVILPSFLLVLLLSTLLYDRKIDQNPLVQGALTYMRPVVTALIGIAALNLAVTAYLPEGAALGMERIAGLDWRSMLMTLAAFLLMTRTKWNPIWMILGSAVLGIFLF